MRVDGPVGPRPGRRRRALLGVVIDAEIQIEPGPREGIGLVGPEMDDVDEPGRRPADMAAGDVGRKLVIEDHGDAADGHGRPIS